MQHVPIPPDQRLDPQPPGLVDDYVRRKAATNGHRPVSFGSFLEREFPPDPPSVIENFLPALDHGFLGGEEKLGKSVYMLYEALCLALGLPLFGKYRVDKPHRVLLIVEEDAPVRVYRRAKAILAGMGLDPNEPRVIAGLNERLMIAPQCRLQFSDPTRRLETWLKQTRPELVYGDALYTLAGVDIMDTREATYLTESLTDLGITYGTAFRLVHHFAKGSGRRRGRGSQELAGPFPWRAWAVQSVFFDTLRGGDTRLTVQSKDQATPPPMRLIWQTEGKPNHHPTVIRLDVESIGPPTRVPGSDPSSMLLNTVKDLEQGSPEGVTIADLIHATGRSKSGVWGHLQQLEESGKLQRTVGIGKAPDRFKTSARVNT